MLRIQRLSLGLLFVLSLPSASSRMAFGQQSDASTQDPTDIPTLLGRVVQIRELTVSYVDIANSSFKNDAAKLTKAKELYADAYSKYSGWNSEVAEAIREGKKKNLLKDAKYKTDATGASDAAGAFVAYVKQNQSTTSESREPITIISSLVDLGLKIWAGAKKQINSDHELVAKNFENATKWQKWDDLTKDGGGHATQNPSVKP